MTTANEIVEEMRRALEARDYMAFVDCFADDGLYELPYALKGRPSSLKGIAKIREYFSGNMTARNRLFEIQKVNLLLHKGAVDGVVFAEFTLEGKAFSPG